MNNNSNGMGIDPTDPAMLNFEKLSESGGSPARGVAHPLKSEASTNGGGPSTPNFPSISSYQKYFQVGYADVHRRLLKALRVVDKDFLESEGNAPELWGPLWITLTLPILLFASSTLAGEWAGFIKAGDIDYSWLSFSFLLVSLFALLEPLIASRAFKSAFASENDPYVQCFEFIPLVMLTCYSWCILVPSLVLAVIPGKWWRIFVIYASNVASGAFVWRNVSETLEKSSMDSRKAISLNILYTTIHAMLFFFIRILFY